MKKDGGKRRRDGNNEGKRRNKDGRGEKDGNNGRNGNNEKDRKNEKNRQRQTSPKGGKPASVSDKDHKPAAAPDYAAALASYCLMDDVYFRAFMRDNYPAAQLMLGIILQKKDIKVTRIETQRDLKNLKGRSLMLDFYGQADGKPVDAEVQNAAAGADFRRARYHSSMLDADSLGAGKNFDELPDTYVVFITKDDIPGYGEPSYLITRHIRGGQEEIHDGSYIIYVNGKYRGDDELGWLMHDFHCTKPEEMHYGALQETAKYLKQTEEGMEKIQSESERLIELGRKEGIQLGERKGIRKGVGRGKKKMARNVAREMIRADEPDRKITKYTGLSPKQVQKLRKKDKERVLVER